MRMDVELKNAVEVAQEEIMHPDDMTKDDILSFKKRLDHLLAVLMKDARDEDDD